MTTSVTFELPPDATYSTSYDQNGNSYYIMSTSTENAPIVARYALDALSDENKANIPLDVKQDIIKGIGLRHVITLPSLLRWVSFGFAAGIAVKAFTSEQLPEPAFEIASKAHKIVEKIIPFSAWTALPAITNGYSAVKSAPYITATAITAVSFATSFVSNEASVLAADSAVGLQKFAKKASSIAKDAIVSIGKISIEYPKVTIATAAIGLGILFKDSTKLPF